MCTKTNRLHASSDIWYNSRCECLYCDYLSRPVFWDDLELSCIVEGIPFELTVVE